MSRRRQSASGLPIVQPRAGAIHIGSRFHVVAVPPEVCAEPVQSFQAFTADLRAHGRLAKVERGSLTVAMESTGVYWVSVYEVLESHGIEAVLCQCARCAHGSRPKERCE